MNGSFKISVLLSVALVQPIAVAQPAVCSFAHSNAVAEPVVLVLQPQVLIRKDKGFSFTESPGATDAVRAGFQGVLARTFENQGDKLLLYPIMDKGWEETSPNDYAIDALNNQFNSMVLPNGLFESCPALSKISFKSDLEKISFKGGPEGLNGDDGFDLVIVSRAQGDMKTKTGKAVAAAAVPIVGWESDALSFSIGVLDRATGSLVYYCSSGAGGNYLDQPDERLSGPIRKCLERYFNNGKPKRR